MVRGLVMDGSYTEIAFRPGDCGDLAPSGSIPILHFDNLDLARFAAGRGHGMFAECAGAGARSRGVCYCGCYAG